jgi:hypothetical protein
MLVATDKHAIGVVAEDGSIDQGREIGSFAEILCVDTMEVVTTIQSPGGVASRPREGFRLPFLRVRLCGKVPDACIGIDDACTCNTYGRIDVGTT